MSQSTTSTSPAECTERAVQLAGESEQPIAPTARDLGLKEHPWHPWIGTYHRAERQERQVQDEHLDEALQRLRKENARVQEAREIVKTAAACFARQRPCSTPGSTSSTPPWRGVVWVGSWQSRAVVMTKGLEARHARTLTPISRCQAAVQRCLAQGRGTYGTRRIKPRLAQEGLQVSRRRIGRLLAQAGLRCTPRRQCHAPLAAGQAQPVAPNQRNREVTGHAPDTVYVGAITDLPPGAGGLSLAGVLELCSRAGVGWSMAHPMRAEWVNQAWTTALGQRQPAAGLIRPTARGRR